MKKMFYLLIVAMATLLLGGCYGKGSSADPPSNFMAVAGDGRVILTWTPAPNVDFWIFTATDPSLTAFNWTGLPNAHAYINAVTPFYMCGLFNGSQYYFAANGRTNSGPGGTSSPTISATPYNAAAGSWTAATPASGVLATTNLKGVGYTGLTTCSNPPYTAISAAGSFATVGASGVIATSADGKTWASPLTLPSGFTTDLYAVTGYAANQNNPTTPNLLWVAVGLGGATVYSKDGLTWTAGNTTMANPNNYTLRSITHNAGTFTAVGDAGTILSTIDGITWTSHTSGTTNNLNGVTHGSIYVAVGNNGTIVTSSNGSNWRVPTSPASIASINLQKVTSFVGSYGTIYVAVGNAGTIVTSKDGGATWVVQAAPAGSPDLVGIVAELRAVDTTTAVADTSLGFISTVQFVAIDSAGNAYTSVNGYSWSAAITTGATSLNTLVSSGFGYVAAGTGGATAYAF